jgi:transcriptional regulator with XRE-family HTH domain
MGSLPELLDRLSRVIRILRPRTGLSQERFALAIGIHRNDIGLLERGRAPNPTMKILHAVALGLGVTIPELFMLAQTEDSVQRLAAGIAPGQRMPSPPTPGSATERLQGEACGRAAQSPGRTRRKGKRGK